MKPEQVAQLRRDVAAIAAALADAPPSPAVGAEPTRSSALRAAAAISDAHPQVDFWPQVLDTELTMHVHEAHRPESERIRRAADIAADFDAVTDVAVLHTDSNDHVHVNGQLAGCTSVTVVVLVPAGEDLDRLLAPLRALVTPVTV